MKKFAVVLISALTALTGVAPAQAFPTVSPPAVQQTAPAVENVQWRGEGRRYYRHDRRGDGYRHHGRRDRHYRHYSRRGDWRHHRRHRDRSNAGAIIGGLAAGAIIGGALAQPRYAPPQRRYVGGGHSEWCYNRYRSYRAYDNTFQPYNGPRQQCYSPYR